MFLKASGYHCVPWQKMCHNVVSPTSQPDKNPMATAINTDAKRNIIFFIFTPPRMSVAQGCLTGCRTDACCMSTYIICFASFNPSVQQIMEASILRKRAKQWSV